MTSIRGALEDIGFSADEIKCPRSAEELHEHNLRSAGVPRVIVMPRTTQLVASAIKVANQFELRVQAMSCGYDFATSGSVDGRMVVDLKHFTEFRMNWDNWEATVGPAVFITDLVQLLHDNGGRAIPYASFPMVLSEGKPHPNRMPIYGMPHISTLNLSGQASTTVMDNTSRKWGHAPDTIAEVEIVTANGEIVIANANKNADLFSVNSASATSII
jgi:FAD/FMN-containing dehydrogenase